MCVCVCVCDGENLMHIVLRKKVVSLLDLVLNLSFFSFFKQCDMLLQKTV